MSHLGILGLHTYLKNDQAYLKSNPKFFDIPKKSWKIPKNICVFGLNLSNLPDILIIYQWYPFLEPSLEPPCPGSPDPIKQPRYWWQTQEQPPHWLCIETDWNSHQSRLRFRLDGIVWSISTKWDFDFYTKNTYFTFHTSNHVQHSFWD